MSEPVTSGRIVVAGNVTIDLIMYGVPVLPAWGQEVAGTGRVEAVAGQAGYLAFAAARLGLSASVISAVGADAAGHRIKAELSAAGVGTHAVETIEGQATQLTVAAVRPDGERAFLSDFGSSRHLTTGLLARHWDLTDGADAVALVGLFNLPGLELAAAAELLGRARDAGAVTVLDTGWDPGGWGTGAVAGVRALLAETDVFLPNLDEAAALTGETGVADVLHALARHSAGQVVVKGGADGSWTLRDGRGGPAGRSAEVLHIPAVPTDADNAVGAGDVYDAAFLAGYLPERDVAAGMLLGTGAASVYVSRRQDRFPDHAAASQAARTTPVTHSRKAAT
jgi:ribokinase